MGLGNVFLKDLIELKHKGALDGATRVITVGQDFVKDGDPVEAVSAAEAAPQPKAEPPA